jgi:MFS family permease
MKQVKYVVFYGVIIAILGYILISVSRLESAPGPTYSLLLSPTSYASASSESILGVLQSRIQQQPFNILSLIIFVCAIIHTLFAPSINQFSHRFKEGSVVQELFHLLGEVEVIFGLWTIPLLIAMTASYDWSTTIKYLETRSFVEPLFVFVIMAVAATQPIVYVAEYILHRLAKVFGGTVKAWWLVILTIGPLLGSLITEPAAMTICALLLIRQFYTLQPSTKLAYATLGLLFTNISVGGVLTNFAAPPVLIVSHAWHWDTAYMFTHFGFKAIIGIILANAIYYFYFRRELEELNLKRHQETEEQHSIPFWIILIHLFVLAWIILHEQSPIIFIGTFFLFLGFVKATKIYQSDVQLRNPLLVAFFLAGLVVHGGLQGWWIEPLLSRFSNYGLTLSSLVLTSFNDNAAVTYLASLIPNFDETMKYAVMVGAIVGGGVTVIANAPNPAGQSLLSPYFPGGVSAKKLFLGALIPTLVMLVIFTTLTHASG